MLMHLLYRPEADVWGSKFPFNTVCGEFSSLAGGWVHGVAFSPSGNAMAFVSEFETSDCHRYLTS